VVIVRPGSNRVYHALCREEVHSKWMGNGEAVSLGNYPESPDSCGAASGSGGELDEVLLASALGGFFAGCLVGEDGVENGPDGFGGSFEQGQHGLE